jgi:hypothetical protein
MCGCNDLNKTAVLSGVNTNLNKLTGKLKTLTKTEDFKHNVDIFIDVELKLLTISMSEWLQSDNFICSNSIFNIMAHIKYKLDELHGGAFTDSTHKKQLATLRSIMSLVDNYVSILHEDKTDVLYFLFERNNTPDNYDDYKLTIQSHVKFFLNLSGIDYVSLTEDLTENNKIIQSYLN